MNIIEYEYLDASGNKHTFHLSPSTQELSDIIWQTAALIFEHLEKNGTIIDYAGIRSRNQGKSYEQKT